MKTILLKLILGPTNYHVNKTPMNRLASAVDVQLSYNISITESLRCVFHLKRIF